MKEERLRNDAGRGAGTRLMWQARFSKGIRKEIYDYRASTLPYSHILKFPHSHIPFILSLKKRGRQKAASFQKNTKTKRYFTILKDAVPSELCTCSI